MQSKAIQLLRQMTNNPSAEFHDGQYESIHELVARKRKMLVVQKTGWGKSAVYFISTKLLREQGAGPTIIISPLIALMRNQISSAARLKLNVVTINSSLTQEQRRASESQIINQRADAILISPEQLANDRFLENVLSRVLSNIGLFVVDEAHCISDWGHDFRPDYQRIVRIIQAMPRNLPVLATTATANDRVVQDIQQQLGKDMLTVRGALMRESLHLQCIPQMYQGQRLAWLASTLPQLKHTGIIYAKTTRDCELVADWLTENGINAKAYHGQTDSDQREQLEHDLLNNNLKVLVATSALGMGFDKPDIGFVIHYQAPGNVIEYYQQVGRAGRGISDAHGILMMGAEDEKIQNYFIEAAFPNEEQVSQLLTALNEAENGLKKSQIEKHTNLSSSNIDKALKFLSVEDPSPILKDGSTYYRTSTDYQLPHERIARLSKIKQGEWAQLLDYHSSKDCLMRFLANALDDDFAQDCGKCANCAPSQRLSLGTLEEIVSAADEFVKLRYIPIRPRKRFGSSGEMALSAFPTYKFNYQEPALVAEPGLALSRWKDGVWGHIVAQGKKDNAFSDELIAPMVTMIQSMPFEQQPRWLTYVPSLRRPTLVKDFAHKLAKALNIHCADTVQMVEQRPEQKTMENSYRRSENLDGAFAIDTEQVYLDPVLLFDDAVDSGWSLTVIAALLRRAQSGAVYPITLTCTSNQG